MSEDQTTGKVSPTDKNPISAGGNIFSYLGDLVVEDLYHLASPQITEHEMLGIKNRILEAVYEGYDGVVVTHGTDTLEETAYFLDLALNINVPIAITGAMRSSNELGSDGLINLQSAILVALSEDSKGKGVLVVMNDEVHHAKFVTKTHTTNVATFQTPTFGPCGLITKNNVIYFQKLTAYECFPVREITKNNIQLVKAYAGMDSFLLEQLVKADLRLCDIQAGGLHNAIPREAHAIVVVPTDRITPLSNELQEFGMRVKEEFSSTEPDATFIATEVTVPADCLTKSQTERILKSLIVVHNGIFAMSQDIDDLVETSSNLANIKREGSQIIVNTSQRSSVASNLTYMAEVIRAAFELGGAQCVTNEGYPGWKVNPKSEIVKVAVESYKRLFKKEPKVRAIHAGLESGLFSEKYPNLDMVSFGPTLRGVHSPDERLLIPTVQMVWDHLLDILKNIPNQ